jgi:hypothetical protein
VRDIKNLLVKSEQPSDLIRDAIQSIVDFVPKIESSCLAASELMRGADLANAHRKFSEIIDGCEWLVETLMHIRGASQGLGQSGTPEFEASWHEADSGLSKVISEVSEAYGRSDHILVADLLEYELTAVLQAWKRTLQPQTQNALQQASSAPSEPAANAAAGNVEI